MSFLNYIHIHICSSDKLFTSLCDMPLPSVNIDSTKPKYWSLNCKKKKIFWFIVYNVRWLFARVVRCPSGQVLWCPSKQAPQWLGVMEKLQLAMQVPLVYITWVGAQAPLARPVIYFWPPWELPVLGGWRGCSALHCRGCPLLQWGHRWWPIGIAWVTLRFLFFLPWVYLS